MSYRPHHPEIATPSPTEPRASTLHTPHANKRKTESSDDPPEKWRRMFNTAPRQGGTPESTKKFTAESARSCSELFQGNGTSTKVNPDVIPGLENKWRFAHNDAKARAEGLLRAWASKAEAEEESIQRARKEESTRLSEKHKADMSKFESRQDMEQRHKREHEELQKKQNEELSMRTDQEATLRIDFENEKTLQEERFNSRLKKVQDEVAKNEATIFSGCEEMLETLKKHSKTRR